MGPSFSAFSNGKYVGWRKNISRTILSALPHSELPHCYPKNGDKENGRAESATELNAIYHGGKKAKIETRTANQEFNVTESGTVGQSGRTAEE